MDHDAITKIVAVNGYGVGVTPNPFALQQKEWERRKKYAVIRKALTDKIVSLFEPRFITPPETSECIESIVTMSDSRKVLELGTHTGFTALHILRALVGKEGALLVSVDCRPAHDTTFFSTPELKPIFRHIPDWTPKCLQQLYGTMFDLVFVDSDHTAEHTNNEMVELWKITQHGSIFLFHDVPEWRQPTDHNPAPVRKWLFEHSRPDVMRGCILPTCEQLDCLDIWGAGYPKQCNPHLGVFVRS